MQTKLESVLKIFESVDTNQSRDHLSLFYPDLSDLDKFRLRISPLVQLSQDLDRVHFLDAENGKNTIQSVLTIFS